jgi:O-antigen/teichoic acid export membrane protein
MPAGWAPGIQRSTHPSLRPPVAKLDMTKAVNPFDLVILGAGNFCHSLRRWTRETVLPERVGVPVRSSVRAAAWTLIDQGIVSAGMFALNVVLARRLVPLDYGTFVLLSGGLFTLQLFNATLLFHPLSVRLVVAEPRDQPRLLCATLLLLIAISLVLACFLAIALVIVSQTHLIAPTLICFLAWQLQEGMRRGLLSSFRHKTAILGDTIRNLGQAALVIALVPVHLLTLVPVLYAMAATAAAAAVIQARQLDLKFSGPLQLQETISKYWQIGGFWALGNGLLAQVRTTGLSWVLAAEASTAAVAGFQAASNIVNLANPIIIGLCNIIPQVASQASVHGNRQAWRSARGYAVLTLPVLLLFSVLVLIMPGAALRIVYGAHSDYLELATPLRLLVLGGLASFIVEIVISYLHGVSAPRLAFFVNGIGALTTAVLAWPMTQGGLTGACITVVLASATRLFAARAMLMRTMSGIRDRRRVGAVIAPPRMPRR